MNSSKVVSRPKTVRAVAKVIRPVVLDVGKTETTKQLKMQPVTAKQIAKSVKVVP